MSINITIKYGGDGTTSQVNDVPSSCTIGKLKKIVAQINKMENSTSIRLVQRGKILQDTQKIESLYLNNQNSLTIYATGIPGKVHKVKSPEIQLRSPGQLNTPLNLQNQKEPFIDRIKNFANQNRRGLIMALSLVVLTFALAFAGIDREATKIPRPKTYLSNGIQSLIKGQISLGGALLLIMIALFFIWILYIIKRVGINVFLKCIILFFKSLLPTFDVESFRNENNLR